MFYRPKGVCSQLMNVELNDSHIITKCEIIGGCGGNTQGICKLVLGMKAEDAIEKIQGIDCGGRGTSCPDQLSVALKQALAEEK